ncbi:hypothetical protein Aduo_018737 [Ancylostoma duodenale]
MWFLSLLFLLERSVVMWRECSMVGISKKQSEVFPDSIGANELYELKATTVTREGNLLEDDLPSWLLQEMKSRAIDDRMRTGWRRKIRKR